MIDFKRKKDKRLIIMVSGRGTNMKAIINTCESEKWPIEIVAVMSDCECPAIEMAKSLNIQTFIFDRKKFKNNSDFELNMTEQIKKLNPTLIALAGFMRVLSSKFCNDFSDKLINIHPSLLPNYKGLHTHKRVLGNKDSIHGASVHAVNEILDSGQILCQGKVPVLKTDKEYHLAKRVMEIEIVIYPYSIAAILSGKVKLVNGYWEKGLLDETFPKFIFYRNYHHPLFKKNKLLID
tara:strand:- start:168 stop:875 length:708 start_codon:yes stop_codon:yes gene_type:complete